MRVCPGCNHTLTVTTFVAVHIEGCPACGGFWFDNHELAWVTQRAPARLHELEAQFPKRVDSVAADPSQKHCPACRDSLTPHEFAHSPGIKMDICKRCHGIWLDHGKLSQIQKRLQHFQQERQQGAPAAAPPQPQPPAQQQPVSPTPPPAQPAAPPAASAPRVGMAAKAKCRQCGTENLSSTKECIQCGARLPVSGRWKPGFCPRCHLGMYPARRSGYIVQACSRCEGLWLPDKLLHDLLGEHLDVMKSLDTNFQLHHHSPSEAKEVHRCPDCMVDLLDENFQCCLPDTEAIETSVLTHRCSDCNGVWFDAGEVHAVWKEVYEQLMAQSR